MWYEEPAWFTTAYFVDPSIICDGGRSQEDWNTWGTGDRLLMKNGATYINIPLTESAAYNDPLWFDHFCFLGMGNHFIGYNYHNAQDCNTVPPLQILFDDGVINGF